MTHTTNFKWQLETRHEAKDRRDKAKQDALDACYAQVDQRDQLHSRRSGKQVFRSHIDPEQRINRHHMQTRGAHPEEIYNPANVVSLSEVEHAEVKAGKARYSGDANLRDVDGKLCGVLYERMSEGGFQKVAMI